MTNTKVEKYSHRTTAVIIFGSPTEFLVVLGLPDTTISTPDVHSCQTRLQLHPTLGATNQGQEVSPLKHFILKLPTEYLTSAFAICGCIANSCGALSRELPRTVSAFLSCR